jgi:hypothetical protein
MRHLRIVLAAAAAVALATVGVIALRQHPNTGRDQTMSGDIVNYDGSTRVLTIRTDAGDGVFVVPSGTTVHEGARKLSVDALPSAVGHRAKVWYRETQGRRTARQIRVAIPAASSQPGSSPVPPH